MVRRVLVSDMMRSSVWDFDSEDKESVAAHAAKMHTARKLALRNPLIPGLDFLCKNIPRIASTQTRNARPVPSFAQATEGVDSGEPTTVLLRLVRSVFAGTWSQVWLAQVVQGDPATQIDTSPTMIVMKFVQGSQLPIPDPDCMSAIRWEYRSPEDVAFREEESYEILRSFQGSLVPYFFGVQKVVFSS